MKPNQQFLFAHPAHFIAFGAGAGLMPKAPGTWGTLVALPIYLLLMPLNADWVIALAAAVLFVVGIWAAGHAGRTLGVSDHSGIVIDEIAAFLLVLAFTPRTMAWCIAAFLLFRFFDIVKPWPIRLADRKIKGGFGVMFDDLLAAIMAIACILFARSLIGGGV